MSIKDDLHAAVEQLAEADAAEALAYIRWLLNGEALSEEDLAAVQRGEAQLAAGDYVTLADLRRSLGR